MHDELKDICLIDKYARDPELQGLHIMSMCVECLLDHTRLVHHAFVVVVVAVVHRNPGIELRSCRRPIATGRWGSRVRCAVRKNVHQPRK